MTFKQRVTEYVPFARSASLLSFAILFASYYNDPNDVVGTCMLACGTTSIVAIFLTPTNNEP